MSKRPVRRKSRSTMAVEPPGPLRKIERRKSKIAGWGVYALEPITKNSRIVHYAGEKISWKESDRRERKYLAKGCIWCFIINKRWVRDAAVGGNIARFINHSCQPNCYVQIVGDVIWIRAARNIKPGEELSYQYETDGGAGFPCRCRPGCTYVL